VRIQFVANEVKKPRVFVASLEREREREREREVRIKENSRV
jgi:hypothetical protein